jgi:bifunctional N-acetylglucosamine-1-phosphate-uridyltransferase/glucosamine-1-phosphate-acetyltransferase GlmU-like protein
MRSDARREHTIVSQRMRRLLIVPAAGLGSRLRASTPKALVPVNGRPMLDHLLGLSASAIDAAVIVAHPSFSQEIAAHVDRSWRKRLPIAIVEQTAPTGMLDAILLASPAVSAERPDAVWIVWCDQVGLLPETLARLAAATEALPPPALVFPTVWRTDPYIHFERDDSGRIRSVLHQREGDQMPAEGESDMGVFALSRAAYETELPRFARDVPPGHATGERNFLPFIPWLAGHDTVITIRCTDPREAMGINTPEDMRTVEDWLRSRPANP